MQFETSYSCNKLSVVESIFFFFLVMEQVEVEVRICRILYPNEEICVSCVSTVPIASTYKSFTFVHIKVNTRGNLLCHFLDGN